MKKVLTLALTIALAFASSQAIAASAKCTVTNVTDGGITLTCDTKADSFKIGDEVKVRSAKKKTKARHKNTKTIHNNA